MKIAGFGAVVLRTGGEREIGLRAVIGRVDRLQFGIGIVGIEAFHIVHGLFRLGAELHAYRTVAVGGRKLPAVLGADMCGQGEFGLIELDACRFKVQCADEIAVAGVCELHVLPTVGGHGGGFGVETGVLQSFGFDADGEFRVGYAIASHRGHDACGAGLLRGRRSARIIDVIFGCHEVRVAVGEVFEVLFPIGSLPWGVRLESFAGAAEIRPGHHIGDVRDLLGDGIGEFGEELGVLVSGSGFVELALSRTPELGEGDDLAAAGRFVSDHLEVFDHRVDPVVRIVGGIIGVVFVVAEHIHPLVTRIGGEVVGGVAVEYAAGGVGVEQVVHALDVTQIIDDVAIQFLVLVGGCVRRSPPEPAPVVFVQWAEDDRDQRAVAALGLLCGGRDGIKLLIEGAGILASRQ